MRKTALCSGHRAVLRLACGRERKHIDVWNELLETALFDSMKNTTSKNARTCGKNQFKDHGKNLDKHFNLPFFIGRMTNIRYGQFYTMRGILLLYPIFTKMSSLFTAFMITFVVVPV